jgi:HD-GYP domain-containing protein (c-di-GMP phosphodiesterase class II)
MTTHPIPNRPGALMPITSEAGHDLEHPRAARTIKAIAVVLREEFGIDFRFFEAREGRPVPVTEADEAGSRSGRPDLVTSASVGRVEVVALPGGDFEIRLPFADQGISAIVAVGVLPSLSRGQPEADQELTRLRRWVASVQDRFRGDGPSARHRPRPGGDLDRQSALAWDAILGLEHLIEGCKIHQEPSRNRGRILRVAAGMLKVEALIWVPSKASEEVLIAGEIKLSPWDCGQLAGMVLLRPEWRKAGFLIDNEAQATGRGVRFPQVGNLLAIPVLDKEPVGWMIAINKRDAGADPAASPALSTFRRSDAALLSPFAALLGLNVRAHQRHQDLKDLLVGMTRSLTSAIDAKDAYTYGHSERVARIAVTIGRELGLSGEELSDLYLAGLLHDVGKIGIRDDVLSKKGPLDDDEFDHIKQHVKIGCQILAGLKAIQHLLPGVLYHHERQDGSGYPEGLKGEAIPLLARILAVADCYDALGTSRSYRRALPRAEVEKILLEGAGSQWDERLVHALLRRRDEAHDIRQRGVGESLRNALSDAMRHRDVPSGLGVDPLG